MKTKAENYINSNVASILRNAQSNKNNFKTMVAYLYARLLEVNKLDVTRKQLEDLMKANVKNANKIFLKEAKFQGKGEVGTEYKKLAELKSYSFND